MIASSRTESALHVAQIGALARPLRSIDGALVPSIHLTSADRAGAVQIAEQLRHRPGRAGPPDHDVGGEVDCGVGLIRAPPPRPVDVAQLMRVQLVTPGAVAWTRYATFIRATS